MILEKAVNHSEHGEHSEETTACIILTYHPLGDARETAKPNFFAVSAVFAVV
ncbi:MAG: hypothetical protein WC023_04525 [Rhodocyclaceae bacterium]